MPEKIEGIILNEQSYSETSKILYLLTKEYGYISVLAKGAKQMKSSLRSVTTKFTYGYFQINYKKDKLSNLISCDVINPLKNIQKDLMKISYASYVLDLTKQVMKQTQNSKVFSLLIMTLLKMEEGFDPSVLTSILELKYLDFLGVMPILDSCSLCGTKVGIITLNASLGGYICKNCYHNEPIYSKKTIQLLRMFYYVDISKIATLEVNEKVQKELNTFLEEYYEKYTGLYLKSKNFLKNIHRLQIKN